MTTLDRRNFLRLTGAGALAAALPNSIRRALAINANNRTGTLEDVEHIVILMQENRSFDHYFGTLRGVRGYGDPRAVFQRDGRAIWRQSNGASEVLPYRPDVPDLGATFLDGTPHDWNTAHQAWNGGQNDNWVPAKGTTTMAHMVRSDLPFHYALADAFTICDAYHCSVMSFTDPNRYYMWTGYVGNDGTGGGPIIDNSEAGYGWSTYPERLERNGISWKVYQDAGDGLTAGGYWGWTGDAYIGNYGDNSLLYFHQYQNAQPGSALYEKARTGTNIKTGGSLFDVFRADVAAGKLPQVSWIAAPEAYSEHPNWPPNYGAWYVAQILDALTANPEVWSKTALLLTFDENDGFFDHVPAPVAPGNGVGGKSTVDTRNEYFAGDSKYIPGPYGLGARVPMLVISPWTRGGYVNSQVFDHTSIIRFIEQRFGNGNADMVEANISPWRRAVCGDLTSCFNFSTPNSATPHLPDVSAFQPADNLRHNSYVPTPPVQGAVPTQEAGVRLTRALPYAFEVDAKLDGKTFTFDFVNTGAAGVFFQVRDGAGSAGPWGYTVEAGKSLSDTLPIAAANGQYDFSVYGPNGFMRRYKGNAGGANVDVTLHHPGTSSHLKLDLRNDGSADVHLSVLDGYLGMRHSVTLKAGQHKPFYLDARLSLRWYDLIVSDGTDGGFRREFAGYIENGRDGISDPAIAAGPATLQDDL
ncbi:MAG: phospholipase C, phosphocholine-specific [Rudaea sp.]|uniref:phosphocholine-specific phospholipase C n=1 Tax=unclassified Rudaea TaxID=2627037 RepID=UPI0010F92B62|nr:MULTISPECIES: phospholipase C, phosphocholine-specific [unclassified Rudaea]MBN8887096.1 phospholipase C, phosphocholine-specific [Rudaea sp.]MBR0347188.1 phospholipase C, phosphocholine-specific [Rudaea sp.]